MANCGIAGIIDADWLPPRATYHFTLRHKIKPYIFLQYEFHQLSFLHYYIRVRKIGKAHKCTKLFTHADIYSSLITYINTSKHTSVYTHIHAHRDVYIHIHTYMHTHMYKDIPHTYIYMYI